LSGSERNTVNDRSNILEKNFHLSLEENENENAYEFEVIIGRHCDMRIGMGNASCGAKRADGGTRIGHRA
jgi:hypothetical protein